MTTSPNRIIDHLGANLYEPRAWRLDDDEVTSRAINVTDRLFLLEIEMPELDEAGRLSEVIQVFFEEFGYVPMINSEASEEDATRNRTRKDTVHEQMSGIVQSISALDEVSLKQYAFRLRIAMGKIDPKKSPNMLRGAEKILEGDMENTAWPSSTQRGMIAVMTLIHKARTSTMSSPDTMPLKPTEEPSHIDTLAAKFTIGQVIELGRILAVVGTDEVVVNTLCALAQDMERVDTDWDDITATMSLAIQNITGEQWIA